MYITWHVPRDQWHRGTGPGPPGGLHNRPTVPDWAAHSAGTLLRLRSASSAICLGRFPLTEEAAAAKVKASALW